MLLSEVPLEVLPDCFELVLDLLEAILVSQVKYKENGDVFFHCHRGVVLLVTEIRVVTEKTGDCHVFSIQLYQLTWIGRGQSGLRRSIYPAKFVHERRFSH
jgi:hypothetical protein